MDSLWGEISAKVSGEKSWAEKLLANSQVRKCGSAQKRECAKTGVRKNGSALMRECPKIEVRKYGSAQK